MVNEFEIDNEALENRDAINAELEGVVVEPKPGTTSDAVLTDASKAEADAEAARIAAEAATAAEGANEDTPPSGEEVEAAEILMQFKSSIETDLGIELTDEDLAGLELTPGLDTASKLASIGAKKLVAQIRAEEFAANPELERAYNHIKAHGSLNGIEDKFQVPDYSKVDLTAEDNQKAMYKAFLEMKGIEEADADDMVTLALDKGVLKDKAENAKQAVVDHFQGELNARVEADKAAIKAQQDSFNQTLTEIKDFVGKGQILGVTLTKDDQKGFLEFITKPIDKSGKTARDAYDEKMSLENDMYLEYLKYKDFKGVTPKVDKKVATLKELAAKGAGRQNEVGSGRSDSNFVPGSQEIDFEALQAHIDSKRK